MNKKTKRGLKDIIIRYSVLLFFALVGFELFYFIFKPLTMHPSFFLFDIFYNPYIVENAIHFYDSVLSFEFIGACIAGSAYLLFFILNFSTPNIKFKKRLALLGISFASFLIINILRIFFIGVMFIENFSYAEFAHIFFWYFGSIFMAILIWFVEVKIFRIKDIPFYTDVKYLIKNLA